MLTSCLPACRDHYHDPACPNRVSPVPTPVGWRCPVCGAGNAPSLAQCPCVERSKGLADRIKGVPVPRLSHGSDTEIYCSLGSRVAEAWEYKADPIPVPDPGPVPGSVVLALWTGSAVPGSGPR